ncbi:substrate-binding domain-containing protein [Streptomyces sp. NRRL S-1022]|uniref:substrate-binding domain-containing protein n=1 Tax=Streptomyces sp. NRRL S-1022 TaxID=1463880 RepID=UPI002D21DB73|nr:substrate-binding domain-containing protein [Streptomyces sp. NRRL S-1022]
MPSTSNVESSVVEPSAVNSVSVESSSVTDRLYDQRGLRKGVGVLILDAADTRALRSSVREAHVAGVPVVAYDRLAEGPVSGFVSFDGAQVGRLQAGPCSRSWAPGRTAGTWSC